jgi:hypothetical protein
LVSANGNDQIVLQDLAVGEGATTLDVSGATVRVQVDGELAEGAEFQILVADQVTGLDSLDLLFDDASLWDVSALSTGKITFGVPACDPNTGGDLDGNGTVEFADFLVLSTNFGNAATDHTTGDIDCNGTVEFADFLVLSENFGSAVGAESAAVPEPSGFVLIGFAGLLGGLLRRRRN